MPSLRFMLTTGILAGLAFVGLLSGWAVLGIASANLRRQFDAALINRVHTFAALVVEDDDRLEFEFEPPLTEADLGVWVRISTPEGRAIAESPGWPVPRLPDPSTGQTASAPQPVAAAIQLRTLHVSRADAGTLRLASLDTYAIHERDARADSGAPAAPSLRAIRVEIAARLEPIEQAEAAVRDALVIAGVIAAVAASVVVWVGVSLGLRPVRRLAAAMDAIDADALGDVGSAAGGTTVERVPGDTSTGGSTPVTRPSFRDLPPHPSEMRPMTAAIDRLLARVGAAMERERRFTEAAAHELRTPLAELRTISEVAQRHPEPARLQRSMDEVHAVVAEMEHLIGGLLIFARASDAVRAAGGDAGDAALTTSPLLPMVREILAGPVGRSLSERVNLELRREPDDVSAARAAWPGPRGATLVILRNLIENAVRYTPDGGYVHITVRLGREVQGGTSRERSEFEIMNGPTSLTAADHEKMFEPFWRADPARSDRSHQGLGLAIVRSLAHALQLDLHSEIAPGGYLRIWLRSRK